MPNAMPQEGLSFSIRGGKLLMGIVVYPVGRGWGFRVTNRESNSALPSHLPLPSLDAAKLRAFDAMVWMK
jgi:hypothetical protein